MDAGYDVTVTHNGGAAWDILMQQPHDILLTDLYVAGNGADVEARRGKGGLSLIGKIKAARRTGSPVWLESMRIIVVTGAAFVMETSLRLASDLGADICLQKPVQPDLLLAAVEEAIHRR